MTNRSRSYEPVSLIVEEVEGFTSQQPQQQQQRRSNDGNRFSTVAIILLTIVATSTVVHTVDRTIMIKPRLSSISVRSPQSTTTSRNSPSRKEDPNPTAPWPRIAWLMSFPNSGTTYTGDMVMTTTNTTSATNYGMESEQSINIPVYDTGENHGPWWRYPDRTKPNAKGYIMTKTHCGGRCTKCRPELYVETTRTFGIACRSGSRHGKNKTKNFVTYQQGVAQRAIHLIRNPFDNLVSRLHMERTNWEIKGYKDRLRRYTPDKKGLKTWCRNIDAAHQEVESRFIDDELYAMEHDLPCHAEFFRYIQWHTQAIEVTRRLKLPVLYLFYENYTTNFDETVQEVLGFLHQDMVAPAPAFVTGKHYEEFFEPNECRMVAKLFQELASEEAWDVVKHYLQQWLS